jgi:hypothetical protein
MTFEGEVVVYNWVEIYIYKQILKQLLNLVLVGYEESSYPTRHH